VTVRENREELRTRQVPTTVLREVCEQVTERVPVKVAVKVPYTVTEQVKVACCE
jgi:hypothetical protein